MLGLDAEVALREVVGEARVRVQQVDADGALVDRDRVVEVVEQPDARGAVAALHPVREVVGDRVGVDGGAVGEPHALPEREGPAQAVVGDAPRLGQPRDDLVVLVEGHQVVQHLVREVGLLDPSAEDARRLLLVGVHDRAALHGLAAAGRVRAADQPDRGEADQACGQGGDGGGRAHVRGSSSRVRVQDPATLCADPEAVESVTKSEETVLHAGSCGVARRHPGAAM